jgi:hypothetical protein
LVGQAELAKQRFQADQMAMVARVSRSRILAGETASIVPASEFLYDDLFDVIR